MATNLKNPIIRPRVTEKGSIVNAGNVYVFEIEQDANKKEVAKTISELYKVKPIRVNIARNPSKEVMHKGKPGRTCAVKKAYVYLKAGDKIEI